MITKNGFVQAFLSNVGGIIVGHREFFQNDTALGFKLTRIQHTRRDHVAHHINRHGQIAIANLGVVTRVFLGRQCIVFATHGIESHRNVERGARRCSFEQQVFEKMGGTEAGGMRPVAIRARGNFVTRADRHPKAQSD